MDYRKILESELKRCDVAETDAYGEQGVVAERGTGGMEACEFLLNNVPTEEEIMMSLHTLAGIGSGDGVLLLPIRPYMQTQLRVTSQRLDELINDNEWVYSWIDYIKALQEVRIVGEFGAGNMEDGRLKWLVWAILGEPVDLATARMSASTDAEATLRDINKYGTDN
jgi:hypothetical protein